VTGSTRGQSEGRSPRRVLRSRSAAPSRPAELRGAGGGRAGAGVSPSPDLAWGSSLPAPPSSGRAGCPVLALGPARAPFSPRAAGAPLSLGPVAPRVLLWPSEGKTRSAVVPPVVFFGWWMVIDDTHDPLGSKAVGLQVFSGVRNQRPRSAPSLCQGECCPFPRPRSLVSAQRNVSEICLWKRLGFAPLSAAAA